MFFKLILLCVLTKFQSSFGKSPFRVCTTEDPCDKDFYCDMFVLFCVPCRDICHERFRKLCQEKCADSKYIGNLAPKAPSTSYPIETFHSFKNMKPDVSTGKRSTTPATRNKSAVTGGADKDNVLLEIGLNRFIYGAVSLKDLVVLIFIVGSFITIISCLCRWCSQRMHWHFSNCFSTEIIDQKTGSTASYSWNRDSNFETSNCSAKLLNTKTEFIVIDDTVKTGQGHTTAGDLSETMNDFFI